MQETMLSDVLLSQLFALSTNLDKVNPVVREFAKPAPVHEDGATLHWKEGIALEIQASGWSHGAATGKIDTTVAFTRVGSLEPGFHLFAILCPFSSLAGSLRGRLSNELKAKAIPIAIDLFPVFKEAHQHIVGLSYETDDLRVNAALRPGGKWQVFPPNARLLSLFISGPNGTVELGRNGDLSFPCWEGDVSDTLAALVRVYSFAQPHTKLSS